MIKVAVLFLSMLIFPAILAGRQSTADALPDGTCAEKRCSQSGPPVRFPFQLRGKQPAGINCSYNPGYDLYCDESNRTILELPSSIKFLVTEIDYASQMMQVKPAEYCIAKQLRHLNLSTTPFQFFTSTGPSVFEDKFSLFNCSTKINREVIPGEIIHCLGTPGYTVFWIPLDTDLSGSDLRGCTKIFDTVTVPDVIFFEDSTMNLTWSLPECKNCKNRGGVCGREIKETNQIRCFRHSGRPMKIYYIVGSMIGFLLLLLASTAIYLAYSKMKLDKENQTRIRKFLEDYRAMRPTRYSYADIKKMTNDFKHLLGEGSNGKVFKAKVSNEIVMAVKLLHNSTENGEEFINEVGTMGKIHHVNVVRLLGFCADGFKRALVYEFLPNGSLDKFIFPQGQEHHTLGMKRLQDIAIGIARGIEYLHQGCEQRILHFDIKPHNILLDDDFNPKISDFGLAKFCEKGRSAVSMAVARGTMGYIAPEVFSRHFGNVSHKSDIYSFGMLLLEMVGRRKNIDNNVRNLSQIYFPEWVYGRLADGEEFRIQVEDDDDGNQNKIAKKLAIAGLWCIQWEPVDRPSITRVLQMLEGNGENLILPPNPFGSSNNAMNQVDNPSSTEQTRMLHFDS